MWKMKSLFAKSDILSWDEDYKCKNLKTVCLQWVYLMEDWNCQKSEIDKWWLNRIRKKNRKTPN